MVRAAFLGTPSTAVPSLRALVEIAELALVVTRPDRARGRSGKPQAPPVKEEALARDLPLAQPTSAAELRAALLQALPLDVGVVVAFGMLLPPQVLEIPRLGFVNVHFSLLPRWRGAAPVARAIEAGDTTTGVTLLQLDEGLDTGPVLASRPASIEPTESAGELGARLAQLGAACLREELPGFLAGDTIPRPQPAEEASYAAKVAPEEARLRPERPAAELELTVRAFNPRPGAYAMMGRDRFKVLRARQVEGVESLPPGELRMEGERLVMGTGAGMLELIEVQPAGRRVMAAAAWARGRRAPLGRLT